MSQTEEYETEGAGKGLHPILPVVTAEEIKADSAESSLGGENFDGLEQFATQGLKKQRLE